MQLLTSQCLFFLLLPAILHLAAVEATIDPDELRTFSELIASRGFRLISYSVTTQDGYILTLHRVVPLDFNAANYSQTRKPVIVHHGLSSSSPDFFINSPCLEPEDPSGTCGDNFGFCLVMTGRYDVWLPNSRGTDFSKDHLYLSSFLPAYWRFSWDQMATKDVPAVLDFVRTTTGHPTVGWVGHSQGSTIMFALLAMKPEYAQIVQPFVAWAPPIFIGDMTSGLKQFAFLESTLVALGGKYILSTQIYQYLNQFECTVTQWLCAASMKAILGDTDSLNETRLGVYNHFYPSGASSWTAAHFIQQIKRNDIYRFDYRSFAANSLAYGRLGQVPRIDLKQIPAGYTIALMYGNTDGFVPLSGVARLKQTLQEAGVNVIDYNVPKEKWNHADFVWGKGAGGLVYDKTVAILDQYTQI